MRWQRGVHALLVSLLAAWLLPGCGSSVIGPIGPVGGSSSMDNPDPSLTSISPTSATAGGLAFTLTLAGSDFFGLSVVRWNGADRDTTFVSSTRLTAEILASDIAVAGTPNVTVFNSGPGGGTTSAVQFTINAINPIPTLTSIDPSSATAGGLEFTLTVNGTNFISGSVVSWDGADRTTTFVSPTQLTAMILASDIAAAGPVDVTIFNPGPGGGTSSALTFTINVSTLAVIERVSVDSAGTEGKPRRFPSFPQC